MIDALVRLTGIRQPKGEVLHRSPEHGVYFTFNTEDRCLRVYRLSNDYLLDLVFVDADDDPLQEALDIQESCYYD